MTNEEKKYNLKIQLRAVQYGTYSKALEYRIDPNQDITYEKEPTTFFERIWHALGFKMIKKFDTEWHQIECFAQHLTMELYDFYDNFNWGPIWCDTQTVLDKFKEQFKTFKDLHDYVKNINLNGHEKWEKARKAYLEKTKTLY